MRAVKCINYENEVVAFFFDILPAQCDIVFWFRYGCQDSLSEIAELWNVTQEWVEMRLATSERLIKERLHATLEAEPTDPIHRWKKDVLAFIDMPPALGEVDSIQLEHRLLQKIRTALAGQFHDRHNKKQPRKGRKHKKRRRHSVLGLPRITIANQKSILFQNESILRDAVARKLVCSFFSSATFIHDDLSGAVPDEIWVWNDHKELLFRLGERLNIILSADCGFFMFVTLTHLSIKDWLTDVYGLSDALPDGGFDGWKRQILVSSDTNEYRTCNCQQ